MSRHNQYMAEKVYIATRLTNESGRHCRGFARAVDEKDFGVYSTKKNAEKAIAKCVANFRECDWGQRLLGFFVREVRVNRMLFENDVWSSIYEQEWSYTKDGMPFAYSPFSSDWRDGAYAGTPPDAIKFNVGDYAWAYIRGKFVPVKVIALPYTPDRWKKKFKFASDVSDDCYLVMAIDGHDHPPTCSLFPMDEEIPGKIMALIEDREKKYLNGESL